MAADVEIFLAVTVDGQEPQGEDAASIDGQVARFKAISGWNVFDGNRDDKNLMEFNTAKVVEVTVDSMGTGGPGDAFENENLPQIYNGVYDFTLDVLDAQCTAQLGFSGKDDSTINDNFLDVMSGDQNLDCDITTRELGSNTCECNVSGSSAGLSPHPKPSSQLDLDVSPIDAWFFEGDPVDFSVTAGTGGVSGTPRFAWYVCKRVNKTTPCLDSSPPRSFDFADGGNFGTATFSTSTSFNEIFDVSGTELQMYDGIVVGYAGQPHTDSEGAYYAASNTFQFDVFPEEQQNSEAIGNSLPSTVTQGTWYASSATMRNIGMASWSGSSYSLEHTVSSPFTPSSVSMTSETVDSDDEYTFNFNLTPEPEPEGWYDNYWYMAHNGSVFGEQNGKRTYIKESSGSQASFMDIGDIFAFLSPRELRASSRLPGKQFEDLQRIRIEDFPLPQDRIVATGRYMLRYEAALGGGEWETNFFFLVEYDPAVFNVGRLERGRRGQSHRIDVVENSPGRLKIEGIRLPGRALRGDGMIFEIPFVLEDGAQAPSTLAFVELVAAR